MRKTIIAAMLLLAVAGTVSAQAPTAPTAPTAPAPAKLEATPPTPMEQLVIENHAMRVALAKADIEVAQLRAKIAELELGKEREAVTAAILRERPGFDFDWNALAFKPKPAAPPKKE